MEVKKGLEPKSSSSSLPFVSDIILVPRDIKMIMEQSLSSSNSWPSWTVWFGLGIK